MIFPEAIRYETEQLCAKKNISTLTEISKRISEGYRSDSAHRTISGDTEILVYAAARMPATFGAVSRALELSLPHFSGEINSAADYGAGTGAGILAVSMLTECESLFAFEQDSSMLELGKHFCEITDTEVEWSKCDITKSFPNCKTDLAVCAYCLNEHSSSARENALEKLSQSADRLLIIEPGTPNSFAQMKKIRTFLIEHGFSIAAPCPHSNECPMPSDDWCHFSERIQRSALHKRLKGGEAPYEDEKFCFIAAQRNENPECCKARILRKPIIQPGNISLDLCTENGLESAVVTKSKPQFKKARKSEVGDSFDL